MPDFILNQYFIALLTTGIINAGLGIFLILKGFNKRLNQLLALYSLSLCIWSIFEAFGITRYNESLALVLWRINHTGVIFIPIFLTHFVFLLLDIKGKRAKLIPISYVIGCILLVLDATPLLILEVVPKFSFRYFINPGHLYYVFFWSWIAWAIYGNFELFKEYFRSSGYRRNQMKYFCWPLLFSYLGGVPNFFPTFNIEIPVLMPYGTYAIPVYAIFATYAIIRYKLISINIVITRAAIFIMVYLIVLGIPFGLAGWFRPWLMGVFGQNWFWIPMLSLLGLATLGPFVFIFLQKKAEGEILKDQRHNHTILMAAAQSLTLVREFHKLLNLLVRILTKTLGIKYATVYLCNREKNQYVFCVTRGGEQNHMALNSGNSLIKYLQGTRKPLVYEEVKREYDDRKDIFTKEIRDAMNKIPADLLVPTFVADELIGFLALGNKRSGEVYTTEDLDVLSNLANQSALAIENAQFLKEREEMQGKLREAETLTTIRDLLGSFNHELYNLLTPISGTLQGINMGLYEEKPERLKSDVEKSITTTFFIKTYLGWVREYVESGDKVAAYQLSELINRGIAYSSDKFEKQNISKRVSVNPKIFVVGYECLPLLFKHLIIHSIYGYGMESGGTIDISARILEDRSTVEIIQTDTGDDLTKYIKEGSTMGGKKFAEKGKLGGTSYFIAQAVVSKHKGSFEVETTGGKGTKFRIRLPLDFNRPAA